LEAAKNTDQQTTLASTPSLFDAHLEVCKDDSIIRKIESYFLETINDRHESRHLRPIRVYTVDIGHMTRAWNDDGKKMPNQKLLWHGTRVFNVLSILKSGLLLPKTLSTMQLAGAMFGNGVYFSDQSTKSLNYAYGYWDGGRRDSNCFMFLADVAMGKEYVAKGSYETFPKAGYDSTFAKAGQSGVMNNEFIVYRTSQCNLRYLVEFDKK
jgi:poly [ADP-ribose] polymerase